VWGKFAAARRMAQRSPATGAEGLLSAGELGRCTVVPYRRAVVPILPFGGGWSAGGTSKIEQSRSAPTRWRPINTWTDFDALGAGRTHLSEGDAPPPAFRGD
jgi:hypothetical protein